MVKNVWAGLFGVGNMKIKFGDWENNDRAQKLVLEAMSSNWISGGPIEKRFESAWGERFGCDYNVAMSSGTGADMAACMSLYEFGARPDDEVIVPALAFIASGNSIWHSRLKPIFVDINRETMNIDAEKIGEKIGDRTRAIMPVHTMGKPCDMDTIMDIANSHKLKVIEDCCEAHGAVYKGRMVGCIGDVGTYSTYTAHIVTACGGGMCSTNNEEMYNHLLSVKSHGRAPGELYFQHDNVGLNFRSGDLTSAVGLAELEKFDKIFGIRKDNFNYLLSSVRDLGDYLYFTEEGDDEVVSPHAFSVTLKDASLDGKGFYNYLRVKGIDCKRNFGSMPTQHKALKWLGHKSGDFPEAEYVGDNGVHFGIHQRLSRDDLDYCSDVLHSYFKKV